MAATPTETSSSDALFAAILCGAVSPKLSSSNEGHSSEGQAQSSGSSNQDTQAGVDDSQVKSAGAASQSGRLDLISYLFVRAYPSQVSAVQARATDAAATDAPAKTPSNAKRDEQFSSASRQIAHASAPSAMVVLQQMPQTIAPIGLTIALGKLSSTLKTSDKRSSVNADQNPMGTAKDVTPTASTAKSNEASHASGTHEAGVPQDCSPDMPEQPGRVPEQASAGDVSTQSLDGNGMSIAPIVMPISLDTMPAAETAGVEKRPVNPGMSMPSLSKLPAPGDSPLPVKAAGHNGQATRTDATNGSSANGDQGNSSTQAGSGAAPTVSTRTTGSSVAAPTQIAPQTPANHSNPAVATGTEKSPRAAAAHSDGSPSVDLTPGGPLPGVNTARLMQTLQQTEMRVGMRSAEFGEISIRSSISQQQVIAQISAAHGELARTISEHLPSLQAKLDHYGVQASIEVSQSGMSFGSERDQASTKHQKQQSAVLQGDTVTPGAEHEHSAMRTDYGQDDGRIDIRA